jgi:hypothetical protein
MADLVPPNNDRPVPPVITEIDILWITAGLGCDGETIALTGATQPSLEELVLGACRGYRKFAFGTRCSRRKMATNFCSRSVRLPTEHSTSTTKRTLDEQLRQTWLCGKTLHEGCDRAGYYEQRDFANEYGCPKCIVKLGYEFLAPPRRSSTERPE